MEGPRVALLDCAAVGDLAASMGWYVHLASDLQELRGLARTGVECVCLSGAHLDAWSAGGEGRWHERPPLVLVIDADEEPPLSRDVDHVLTRPVQPGRVRWTLRQTRQQVQQRNDARALEAALNLVSDSVEVTDAEARFLWVNEAFEQITGYRRNDAVGQTPASLLRDPSVDERFYEAMWETLQNGQRWSGLMTSRTVDNHRLHQLASVRPVLDERGRIARIVAVKREMPAAVPTWERLEDSSVTWARAQLNSLESSRAMARALMDAAADAILVADTDSAFIIDANEAAREMFGYSDAELRHLTLRMLSPTESSKDIDAIAEAILGRGAAQHPRLRMRRRDGSTFWAWLRVRVFEVSGRSVYSAILRDVSAVVEQEAKLERAHQDLEESARLAALGELAASVAHELNSPLQFVTLNARVLDENSGHDAAERREALEDIGQGLARMEAIIRTLLPFSRVEDSVEEVNLAEAAKLGSRMVDNQIRHRAELILELKPAPVMGQPGQLGQLATNLILNAAQAITAGHASDNAVRVQTYVEDGHAWMVVEDTGAGIDPAVRDRIFEPFFTTKRPGDGTGIGLAVCASIVRRHEGTIRAGTSADGRGARFEVKIPCRRREVSVAPRSAATGPVAPARVLMVDDDLLVLRAQKRTLGRRHELVTAASGAEALEILAEDDRFDVVFCDVMMPSMDGPELLRQVARRHAELVKRFVFWTGGAFTEDARSVTSRGDHLVLQKPVSLEELENAIEEVRRIHPA